MKPPHGNCLICGTPRELLMNIDPREDKRHIIYPVRCPGCGRTGGHIVTKPGPWRDLNPTSTEYPRGVRCPNCSSPVEFAKNRKRAVCEACGVHVDLAGNIGTKCDYCGHIHWSDQARSWCEMYEYFKVKAKDPSPHLVEGSKEAPPWGERDFWNALRELIMKRDDNTCQDCGLSEDKRNHLIEERLAEARKTSPNPYPSIEYPPELRVHHIVPRVGGGTDHPRNLVTLCEVCHLERHKLIGDGYEPFLEVTMALLRDEVVGEERARLLAGDHPIVIQARERRQMTSKQRQLYGDIEQGVQATLEVMD